MAVRSGKFNPVWDAKRGKRGRRGSGAPTPAFTSAPSIALTSGDGSAGSVYTMTDATISDGSITGRQWYLAGVEISGGTDSTYTAQDEDTLLELTAKNFAGDLASDLSNAVLIPVGRATYRYYKIIISRDSAASPGVAHSIAEIQMMNAASSAVSGTWSASSIINAIANINDGNTATYWSTGTSQPVGLTFDGGAAFALTELKIMPRGTTSGGNEAPGAFKLYGSNTATDTSTSNLTGWALLDDVPYPSGGGANAWGYANPIFTTFSVPAVAGLSLSVTQGAKSVGSQAFTPSVTDTTGAGGTTQVRAVNATTGGVAVDWQSSSSDMAIPGGGYYRCDVRNSAVPGKVSSTASDLVSHALWPMVLGQNLGYSYHGQQTVDVAKSSILRYGYSYLQAPGYEANQAGTPGSTVGMGLDGLPQSLPSGQIIRMNVPDILPPSMLNQNWTLTTSPGVTISLGSGTDLTGAAARNFTLVSTNSGTGIHVFHFGADYNDAAGTNTFCYVAITAIPSGMDVWTFIPDNYASGDIIPSEMVADFAWVKVIRPMTPTGTNSTVTATSLSDRSPADVTCWQMGAGMPPEWAVATANALGADLWLTLPLEAGDDLIADYANACKMLTPGLKVHVELSNEIWNRIFLQYATAMLLGLRRGYGSVSIVEDAAPEPIIDGRAIVNGTTGVTSEDLADGDKIFLKNATGGSAGGFNVYTAIGDQAAGVNAIPLDGTSNGNWSYTYTNAQCVNASQGFQSSRSKEMWAIFDTIVGRSNVVHALMQQISSNISLWQKALDWDGVGRIVDEFGFATYFQCDLTYTGSTSALKAATTQADWITAYMAALEADIVSEVAHVATLVEWLDSYAAAAGRGQIVPAYYEGGRSEGPPSGDWTEAGGLATVQGWWVAARRDVGLTTVTTDWLDAVAAAGGGLQVNFVDYQPIGNPGWGSKENIAQASNPVWSALDAYGSQG